MLTLHFEIKELIFKKPSGTSRGIMHSRKTGIITVSNGIYVGLGEIAPLPRLSIDDDWDQITSFIKELNIPQSILDNDSDIFHWVTNHIPGSLPSIRFGLECALMDLKNHAHRVIFNNDFSIGTQQIPINGLVWMDSVENMKTQITQLIDSGFSVIKLKIGALDFKKECALLSWIREKYPAVTLRLDANGAFGTEDVIEKLNQLSIFHIHSIEQPIAPRQPLAMEMVCKYAPIPIALDEELIGNYDLNQKIDLLETIKPAYLILKPSLHGGIFGCDEWIQLAENRNIDWWFTSALESNLGLYYICQLTAQYIQNQTHGLGTGSLFTQNLTSFTHVEKGHIRKQTMV